MRILLLTQVVPYPPDSGPKIKTFNVLRYLAERHEVHLLAYVRSAAEEADAQSLCRYCASVTTVPIHRSRLGDIGYFLRSLLSGRPFLIERDDLRAMRTAVTRKLAEFRFDAIHADQLSMGQFAVDAPLPLRVLDEHNGVWTIVRRAAGRERLGPRRLAAELEWRKLRAYEGALCRQFDRVTVVSDEDRRVLEEAAAGAFAALEIPIAIDSEQLAFHERESASSSKDVLSVATMFYPPNQEGVYWFATESFPLVRRQVPDARFVIVGSRPPAHIQALSQDGRGIDVTGYVADVEPLFRRSAVLVVPVHSGSGMRVKILEAFARGIPVVSTTVGVEGIDAKPGVHLLVGDTPEEFAGAVIRLLSEPETASLVAENGRRLVEERYDWRSALAGLETIYPTLPRPSGAVPADLQQ